MISFQKFVRCSEKQVQRFDLSSFKIISNTSQCQAVQLDQDTYLLALYEATDMNHFVEESHDLYR